MKLETKDLVVTYSDTEETKQKLFDIVLAFCTKHGCFHPESAAQCDAPQLGAVDLMCDMIECLDFEVKYKDEL